MANRNWLHFDISGYLNNRAWSIRHCSHHFATQPVILWTELGGKPKWLPLNSGYHDIMHTVPFVQLGAVKLVLWRHWMHVTQVHPEWRQRTNFTAPCCTCSCILHWSFSDPGGWFIQTPHPHQLRAWHHDYDAKTDTTKKKVLSPISGKPCS